MKQDDNSNKAVEERQVDYKGFLDEYLAARARYKESHSTADYKAMNECYDKYGIPQDERKPIATLLQMQDNTIHSDGKEVSRIPADVFEKSLAEGQWKEVISTIKTNTDATAINEVTEGKYPVLGEIFKSDRKNANLVMQAFGLFREDDNYVVRINPEKFHLYDYETFFAKDIKEVFRDNAVHMKTADGRSIDIIPTAGGASVQVEGKGNGFSSHVNMNKQEYEAFLSMDGSRQVSFIGNFLRRYDDPSIKIDGENGVKNMKGKAPGIGRIAFAGDKEKQTEDIEAVLSARFEEHTQRQSHHQGMHL